MNTGIYFEAAWYWLPLCLLLGAGYAALLYFKEKKIAAAAQKKQAAIVAMALFRFAAVSIIAILLMGPFLKMRFSKTQKPIVVLLNDNSESVSNSFAKGDSALLQSQLNSISKKLSEKYEVLHYNFNSTISENNNFAYNGKTTNISSALTEIQERFLNRNLGAVMLVSDGIYNQGENPIYTTQDFNANIFTVALGDTTLQRDLKLAEVLHNKTANITEQIPLKISTEATNLQGKTTELKIEEIQDSASAILRYNKIVTLGSQQNFQTFDVLLPASKAGVVRYRVSLSHLDGEVTYRNNVRDIFIEVLENKEQVLLVFNSPHPDVAALKTAIETNKSFSVKAVAASDFAEPLNGYSLIIAYQLPSVKNKASNLFTKAKELHKPILFILGSQTAYNDLKQWQTVIDVNASGNKLNEVTANFNTAFSLFTLQSSTTEALSKLPPLSVAFGNFKSTAGSSAFLFQKINHVSTDFPLIAFNEEGESKQGCIAGEGIWRWRLYDFLQNKSHQATNEIITKTVQLLSTKADKRPFRVSTPKNIFNENEQVTFDAQLFNSNYEAVNQPDVALTLKHAEGNTYNFNFARTQNAYNLNTGNLPIGNYTYTAKTSLGGKQFTASGKISISPLQLETARTRADYELMMQLAAKHNGKTYSLQTMPAAANDILALDTAKPVIYDSYLTENAINLQWIFALLVLLFSAEWFTRKYLGAY